MVRFIEWASFGKRANSWNWWVISDDWWNGWLSNWWNRLWVRVIVENRSNRWNECSFKVSPKNIANLTFDRGMGPALSLKKAWFSTQNFQNAFAALRLLKANVFTSDALPSSRRNLIKKHFCLNETFLIKFQPHVFTSDVSWKTKMPSAPADRRQELPCESRQLTGLAPYVSRLRIFSNRAKSDSNGFS